MGKFILIILIVLIVYWLIKSRKPTSTDTESLTDASEDMVRCAHCGVHLPESESITSDGNYFCSKDHYQKYLATKL